MKINLAIRIVATWIIFVAFTTDSADAQNRDRRDEKTRDFHSSKDEFRPKRHWGKENKLPVVVQRFRNINGTENNLRNPSWGQAGANLRRRTPSMYADGISEPAGEDRPSPRLISNLVCDQLDSIPNERLLSSMVWQWGQFLDHDIALSESADPLEAFPISVPSGDPFFDPFNTGTQIISLFRTEYRHGSQPREQINLITSWIDGSNVYGSDLETSRSLRTLSGGLMKTSAGDLLPTDGEGFFLAGDIRVNEQPGLICMHTIFVREHNRIARRYTELAPQMSDEQVYLRARKWVVGMMQAITYNEFLPAVLGDNAMRPYRGYKADTFPNLSNVFSTAAYRFGHTMIPSELLRLDSSNTVVADGNVALRDGFFNPSLIRDSGVDPFVRGLMKQQAEEIDTKVRDDLRNFLFGPPGSGGFDLASLNIQRGRDHGLADYNTVRMRFGLPPVSTFADITSDVSQQLALEDAYGDVDNIDSWVGLLSEDHVYDASVGATLTAIFTEQFEALRDGDRFWYQNDMGRREAEIVDQTKLTNIIRRNTGITHPGFDAFRVAGP